MSTPQQRLEIVAADEYEIEQDVLNWAELDEDWEKSHLADHVDFMRDIVGQAKHAEVEETDMEADEPGKPKGDAADQPLRGCDWRATSGEAVVTLDPVCRFVPVRAYQRKNWRLYGAIRSDRAGEIDENTARQQISQLVGGIVEPAIVGTTSERLSPLFVQT